MEKKNPKKLSHMTDEDIVDFLEKIVDDKNNISDESEADFDGDEFDDPDYVCPADEMEIDRLINSTEVLTNAINLSINVSNVEEMGPDLLTASAEPVLPPITRKSKKRQKETEFEEEVDGPSCSTSGIFSGISSQIKIDSKEFKNIIWRQKPFQLHVNEIVFRGEKHLPEQFYSLKTPYDCLAYFITEDFLKNLANQMNLYARQQDISSKFTTNAIELRKFIGILYMMSVYRYPNVRSYWGRHSLAPVREAMSRNRFEEIRSKLHFNDNTNLCKKGEIGYDALYKIRPIITHFNERFLTFCIQVQVIQ